ncbi:hypothetical protein V8C35DRAFT_330170 [Trichoderma chlorosporum]
MDPGLQEKGTLAWTEEAKFQFLLRIVAQLKGDGRGIKWEKINIPGRTVKSLQNMWTKINKQINDFEAREKSGEDVVMPTKPRKRGPPRKKSLSGAVDQGDDGLDDDDFDTKQKLWKKRAAEGMVMAFSEESEYDATDTIPCPYLDYEDLDLGVQKKRAKVKAEATTDGIVRFKKEGK